MDEMQRLADLGADLSPAEVPVARLRARMPVGAAAAVPDTRSHWVRPALVAASVLSLAAGAAVVANATTGSEGPGAGGREAGTPPVAAAPPAVRSAAFTVARNADGSVTFTMHELTDLAGATQALNEAGLVGRVVTSTEDCTTGPNAVPVNPADLYPPDTVHRLGDHGRVAGGDTVTLRSSDYPPGGGLLLTVTRDVERDGSWHLTVAYLAYVDAAKIPTCVNFVDPQEHQLRVHVGDHQVPAGAEHPWRARPAPGRARARRPGPGRQVRRVPVWLLWGTIDHE